MPFAAIQMDLKIIMDFPGGANDKEPICQCRRHRRPGFSPWIGKIPGGGHGNPLQYSCLENPVGREAWWAAVYRVTKHQTRLRQLSMCMSRAYHTKWSKLNRDRQISYDVSYTWNLKTVIQMNLFTNRNRPTNIESKLMVNNRERGG